MNESTFCPSFASKPQWMLERRLERLQRLRELYRQRLIEIEAEITELRVLLKIGS